MAKGKSDPAAGNSGAVEGMRRVDKEGKLRPLVEDPETPDRFSYNDPREFTIERKEDR